MRIGFAGAATCQKLRSWLGPNRVVSGSPPPDRSGMGFAAVSSGGASRLYIFGGAGPSAPNGLGDLFRFARSLGE
jgi:hypothetical protein